MAFYFISLPIGNLGDISLRALEILRKADFILAEKPRKTLRLLNFYKIKKPIYPYFSGKNERYLEKAIKAARDGKIIVFLPEAGSCNVADPGAKIVQRLIEERIDYSVVPGASALTAAISCLPWSAKNFVFLGFLPKKGLRKVLKNIPPKFLIIYFSSPYRIKKNLEKTKEILGDREVFVGRELTKKFEEKYLGRISEVLPNIKEKGEFVVAVSQS